MQSSDLLNGCYRKIKKIGEGSSGKVYLTDQIASAQDENSNLANSSPAINNGKIDKKYYALKKIKLQKGHGPQSINEWQLMQLFKCPNLMTAESSFVRDKGYCRQLYLVMQFMVGIIDILSLKEVKLTDMQIKQICYQLVSSLQWLHSHNYIHRDVKPSNIMVDRTGNIRLADFSITTVLRETMTANTTTRYYRAPQLMFGERKYGFEVDIWSLGCTFAELVLHEPLFQGTTDISQLEKIFSTVGYPVNYHLMQKDLWPEAKQKYPYYLEFEPAGVIGLKNIIPNCSQEFLDLLGQLLTLNPLKRPTIKQVKEHKYFSNVNSDYSELGKLAAYVHDKKIKQLTK